MAMSYTRRCLLVIVLLLIACVVNADELGASLHLEGRMACQRGVARLITWQDAEGSWQQDPGLTAHAALALTAAAGEFLDAQAARQRALAFVQERLLRAATPLSPSASENEQQVAVGAVAMALRLFLREGALVPPESVGRLRDIVAAGKVPAADAMIVLDALLLMQQTNAGNAVLVGAKAGSESVHLSNQLLANIIANGDDAVPAGVRLAARMATGDVTVGAAARRRLEGVSGDGNGALLAELYWLARVLYAQGSSGDDTAAWRTQLMTVLLEMQRGDGGWGRVGDSPAARIVDSAWALQALAVLLAAAPQGGEWHR